MRIFAWVVLAAGLLLVGAGILSHASAYQDVSAAGGNASPAQLASGLAGATRLLALGVPLAVAGAVLAIVSAIDDLRRSPAKP
jgi:hypothetical protein